MKNIAGKIAIIACILSLFPYSPLYVQPVPLVAGITAQTDIPLPSPPEIPVNETRVPVGGITSSGVIIKDIPSGVVLFADQATSHFAPASTTKLMTSMIARTHFALDETLSVSTVITEGRTMKLVSGERLSFESLLYAALVHSANDAMYTIAENYPGGVPGVVAAMNAKSDELLLAGTHFTNPIGFDDPRHYTTPRDLATIAITALTDPIIAKMVGTQAITVSDVTYTYFHPLTNVNELLGKVPGMSGVKTGYTDLAGEVLVSQVKRDDRSVLFVVMNSIDRFGETARLVDWVFSNIRWYPAATIIPTNL